LAGKPIEMRNKKTREQLENLKTQVEETLSQVDFVIGYAKGYDVLHPTPLFVRSTKDAQALIWDDFCINNLATYLPSQKRPGGLFHPHEKIGLVVKGCDSRAVIQLLQEGIIDRENFKIIGISCQGKVDVKKLKNRVPIERVESAEIKEGSIELTVDSRGQKYPLEEVLYSKCLSCEYPTPLIYDRLVGGEGSLRSKGPKEFAQDPYHDVEEFEKKGVNERLDFWEQEFSRCLRCYACRDICPFCYCQFECIAQTRIPHWLSQKTASKENKFFHMFRAMHLAGRCTECGECERACPVDLPLLLLHKKMNKKVSELFGYKSGINPKLRPPLIIFQPEEKNIEEEKWE